MNGKVSLICLSILLVLCLSRCASADIEKRQFSDDELEKFRSMLKDPKDEEYDDDEQENDSSYENVWIVGLDAADKDIANTIASKYGFENQGKVANLDGIYKFYHHAHTHHDKQEENEADSNTENDPDTTEATSTKKLHIRTKRDHIEHANLLRAHPQVKWVKRERVLSREKREGMPRPHEKSDGELNFNDPLLSEEWYIRNSGQTSGPAKFDSKVYDAWKKGYTGKGVVLSVLDDGMDHTHPELKDNYDPKASTDLNGHDADPFPNDSDPYNAHGTKCSGTIAAKANNGVCGVGIAYDAKVGAIRMLDGKATDSLEANALSFNPSHIDIYSCSWGPRDNGKTFGRPGKLGRLALEAGATLGRKGLGSIYVWATGNGGMAKDDCNADGYVNSIYTISIGSVNDYGVSTYYCEQCSSTMAVTYCSGQHKYGDSDSRANVITTYLHHQCTKHFVGTSSAAPLAAGIFALVLQANPKLSWRDLQHLVVATADLTSPLDPAWRSNGVGHHYNAKFGFGVLNALKMIEHALKWKPVGPQHVCHFPIRLKNKDIPSQGALKIRIKTDACQTCLPKDKDSNGTCKHAVTKLEHVVLTVTLKHRKRGDLSIELYSPSGTKSKLLHRRQNDDSKNGLKDWSFMTVYNWGENPKGVWVLKFIDRETIVTRDFSKRYQRDMEEIYVKMLDKRKRKAEMEKEHKKKSASSTESNDDESEELHGHLHEDIAKSAADAPDAAIYKRAFDELRGKYPFRKDEEDDDDDDGDFKRGTNYVDDKGHRDIDDEEKYLSKRKRRTLRKSDSLESSPVAGVIEKLSLTLYGTAD